MATTLDLVSGELDYGSTHNEDIVVPFRKPPSRSWKTKKVVIGIIMGVTAVVVLADAGLLAQTGQSFLLQGMFPATITNKTPYNVDRFRTAVDYLGCASDHIGDDGLYAGQTWTASSRGLCLVNRIYVDLIRPDLPGGFLECAPYTSTGTAYSIYSIRMDYM